MTSLYHVVLFMLKFSPNMADSKFQRDEVDNEATLVICAAVIAVIAQALQYVSVPKRQHSCWVRGYLHQCPKYGAYNSLMRDLQLHNAVKLKNYSRMDLVLFEEFFEKIEELITTKDTKYR